MRDLLKELYEKKITKDQAYDILDDVVDKFHDGIIKNDPFIELMFDKYEATARCHSVSLKTLAKWRYEGWPTVCSKCKKFLNYKDFGWFAKDNKLTHIKCL